MKAAKNQTFNINIQKKVGTLEWTRKERTNKRGEKDRNRFIRTLVCLLASGAELAQCLPAVNRNQSSSLLINHLFRAVLCTAVFCIM